MNETLDDILDSPFHFAALRAFMEQAAIEGGRPSLIATRERAYELYEAALAVKNGRPDVG